MSRKPLSERLSEATEKLKQLRALKAKQEARDRAIAKKLERQEDANQKIRLGGLVVLAGLAGIDKGVLLGALIDVELAKTDLQKTSRWKAMGDDLLNRQAAENRHSAAAQKQE